MVLRLFSGFFSSPFTPSLSFLLPPLLSPSVTLSLSQGHRLGGHKIELVWSRLYSGSFFVSRKRAESRILTCVLSNHRHSVCMCVHVCVLGEVYFHLNPFTVQGFVCCNDTLIYMYISIYDGIYDGQYFED